MWGVGVHLSLLPRPASLMPSRSLGFNYKMQKREAAVS